MNERAEFVPTLLSWRRAQRIKACLDREEGNETENGARRGLLLSAEETELSLMIEALLDENPRLGYEKWPKSDPFKDFPKARTFPEK